MKTYKNESVIAVFQKSITCDVCKKTYDVDNSDDCMEIQEFVSFSDIGGYASIVSDGVSYSIDMCQHCAFKLLGDYYYYPEDETEEE